jgi:RNA 2',3'-cyclic 3'-phosphodiesterase
MATTLKGNELMLRTFIALNLPDESMQFLTDCVSHLKRSGVAGSFVRPSNYHLTLKFLGDTEETLVSAIESKLEEINLSSMPFNFSNSGVFPKISNVRVVWYGVEAKGLIELAGQIDALTSSFGFAKEDKPFVAHLTLVRIKEKKPVNLEQTLDLLPKPPKNQHFVSLEFIKSELNPNGSIYTPLWQRKLKGEN